MNKKQKGSALIASIVLVLFLGILGTMMFNSSQTELKIASNITSKNLKFQAAENAIFLTLEEQFYDDDDIAEILEMSNDEIITHCSSNGESKKNTNCDDAFMNADNTVKSYSSVYISGDSECFSYGNSDQKAYCYIVEGTGSIPLLNNKDIVNVQELQVTVINSNSNGVYEF